MSSPKQSLWDWYNQNKKQLQKTTSGIVVCFGEWIELSYPSGFKVRLLPSDFPNRNGEWGQDAIPGPSHKRLLEGGSFSGGRSLMTPKTFTIEEA